MMRSLMNTLIPPAEGFYSVTLPQLPSQPMRIFLPSGYEQNYAYPLILLLHSNLGSEEQAIRLAPRISRRNFIVASLRGPVANQTQDDDGLATYSWDAPGRDDHATTDYILRSLKELRLRYHVHSDRLYLAGIGEGAAAAYRYAATMPHTLAGLIAINGQLPLELMSQFSKAEANHLRVLMAHGASNVQTPLEAARRDFLALYGTGIDISLHAYAASNRVHPNMLRDINRWMIHNINEENLYDACESEDQSSELE